MQNQVTITMCNRVGEEGDVTFTGRSVVVDSYSNVISEADGKERLIIADIDLSQTAVARKRRPFLGLRRPEWYTLMRTEPGIGMLTVDYAVMAELRRI